VTPDVINAVFEGVGALIVARDALQLWRDRMIRGVYWPARLFFAAWGLWNCAFYPLIGQPWSFAAGCCLTTMTMLWVALAVRFRSQ
jgi:hypothetical protein